MNPALNNPNQPFSPGLSSDDAKAFLTGSHDDPAHEVGRMNALAPTYHHLLHDRFAFRPLEPSSIPDFEPRTAAALKIETEQPSGIMQMQTEEVDTSQYAPVPNEEVWSTPYDASSPSSVETVDDSPATPSYNQHEASFNQYARKYGSRDHRSYFGNSHIANKLDPSQSSFGASSSFSFDNSAKYFNSSFTANNSFSGRPLGFGQPQELVNNPQTAHDDLYQGGHVADPTFDDQAVNGWNFSESEVEDEDTASEGTASSGRGMRSERDQLLLDLRAQGYSYKDIKRTHNLKEAESTLRGRIRVLTKQKHERVRKPVWHASDIRLLHSAVKRYTSSLSSSSGSRRRSRAKIPWKKISNWMFEHGASYAFAGATCARKWEEVGGR